MMQKPEPTLHPAIEMYADEVRTGALSRREFLTRVTALGLAAPMAYGLLGLEAPAFAQDTPQAGGTLRMNMELKALKDPRTADWSQIANFMRGWLDYLVEYNNDGTIRGMLLDSWEANDTVTEYVLKLRPGTKWSNGDDFTAEDVVHNFGRWADSKVEGNSMAGRCVTLQDPATGQIREGAVTVVDPLTVKLSLSAPDVAIIAALADYPAMVTHKTYTDGDPTQFPGTGPFKYENYETGVRGTLVKNDNWWGSAVYGGPYLDKVEYVDLGSDPSAWVAAAGSGEIDATYQSSGEFIEVLDGMGWNKTEAITSSTIAVRFNQDAAEYKDVNVRRGLQMCVNNAVVLELGYAGLGTTAENHHVCPIHPEYYALPPITFDPVKGAQMVKDAGFGDFEFELTSLDDDWQAASCDTIAAQIRDAGLKIKRTVLPGATYWNDWTKFPFSGTEWVTRPLGVQVLAVAYRTGEPWNESAFSNAEFDEQLGKALSVADAKARSEVMKRVEEILQEQGVLIQPYWRSLYRHTDPKVHDCPQHVAFEHHHYKWWVAA